MCGIIACRTHAPAIDYLLAALRRLEYRGYDSAGVAVRTVSGDVARLRTVGRIGALDRAVSSWTGPGLDGVGIGHTRWATHGAVTEGNAHPHVDCTGRISVVHNGIIDNAEALRQVLATLGHHFASSVDSEVLCHLIEDQLEMSGDLFDAVQAALTPLEGSWALAVLEEHTIAMQEALIRGPAPLGPGAPPQERLKAMARAQLALLDEHGDLLAAGETGRPGARIRTGPHEFLRMHAGMLIREADPEADWEILADFLLASLAADAYFYWCKVRGHEIERVAAAFDVLVDRLLP